MKFNKRFLKVTLVSAIVLMSIPMGRVTATAETSSKCWNYRTAEKGFFHKLNEARSKGGKPSLHLDKELSKAARRHTWEMTTKDLLYHTPSPTMRSRVTNWQLIGENVGVGGTVDSLHIAFMNSPDHKRNIMEGSFKHVGIGTRMEHGRLWVTVIFEAQTNPGTTLPMPSC